ncbi:MAG: precorrin-4 C(11)-methyltransferase [Syntrophales bacterium]|nr:precorrin-4 C(11)-methyltransferase [Syntrophales bacterium]
MKIIFVGAGPGDPELLTVRARKALRKCRICIFAGSLVSPAVMKIVPKEAELHDSAHMALEEIMDVCRRARDRGIDAVRLHSGDPSLYGAIREQMSGLDRLGIPYEVIPGVSAFQAAAAALKAELTAPEVSQTVILTRTSGRTRVPPPQELKELARSQSTLCIYLSGDKIDEVARALVPFYGDACPAAVVYHASWPDQSVVEGALSEIAGKAGRAGIGRTSVIIVGQALSRGAPASKLYDAAFSHGFRKGGKG